MPLMLHCGSLVVTRSQLAEAPTPERTSKWVPLRHLTLLELLERGLAEGGFQVTGQAHALSHQGERYFGLLEVSRGKVNGNSSWVVGLRNSHDQRFCAGLIAGARVLVCDNLSFSGEVKLEHKHSRHLLVHLRHWMPQVVERLNEFWGRHEQRISRYQDYALDEATAHDLVVRAVDAGVCSNRSIPAVLREWRHPHREAFRPRTGWSLFNGFTEILKGRVFELPSRTARLHQLFDAQVNLKPTPHGRRSISAN